MNERRKKNGKREATKKGDIDRQIVEKEREEAKNKKGR